MNFRRLGKLDPIPLEGLAGRAPLEHRARTYFIEIVDRRIDTLGQCRWRCMPPHGTLEALDVAHRTLL
jgi:hypothetical protein